MDAEKVSRPRRVNLAQYYANDDAPSSSKSASQSPEPPKNDLESTAETRNPNHIFNINGPNFDADQYTQKLIKEATLGQLTHQSNEINRQIGSLDSEMQTLVYENYNKFISATDTIKKMRVDFRAMEDEMDQLASKMQNITVFSNQITETLRDRRVRIGQLSGTHALLKKLQFLFELPAKLNECIQEDNLSQGVKYYLRAQKVLDQYEHMNSFKGIKSDCDQIMETLRNRLLQRLQEPETKPEELAICVNLALQLNEPAEKLCDMYLETARLNLAEPFDVMQKQLAILSGEEFSTDRPSDAYQAPMDILEFVDHGCNTYVSDVCLVIAAYKDTFGFECETEARDQSVDQTMAKKQISRICQCPEQKVFQLIKIKIKIGKGRRRYRHASAGLGQISSANPSHDPSLASH